MLHSAEAPALSRAAPTVTIRPAMPADLAAMAGWQCRHVPDGLFPQMGERFVRRWHASFLDSPFGVALVAERHDGSGAGGAAAGGGPDGGAPAGGAPAEPIGFLVGSTDQVRHVAEVVRRHRVGLAFGGLVALAGRPRLAAHFIRTRGRSYLSRIFRNANARGRQPADSAASGAPAAAVTTAADQVAVITAVAVDNAARGSGAGQLLVERFLEEARAAGAPRAELVAMLGEGSAAPFYDRLGWIAVGEHSSRDGSLARTYRYNLS
ncbi:GNAT family N-acetyltransferase [Arthrobacter mangrovi]|uniref:GNAT family N-acetyltransferase n=1 Tax=Arthrobacter mangrovi TaxID=2966350 RepID=UPI0022319071|nr:GNAT family N-acetyltransferase [Arthrobacter mangrovi]